MGTNSAPLLPSNTISWSKQWNRTLPKPSSSATPFGISTIYSVLTIWTLEITSAQFTLRNCNLRPLPHHLLKCVISTHISRREVQIHLSVSASTIRGMTLHSGLSTFLIWTATFPPLQLTVFIYLNWWDMLEFALPKLTSSIDSVDLKPHLHALKIGHGTPNFLAPCLNHFGTALPIYTTQNKRFFSSWARFQFLIGTRGGQKTPIAPGTFFVSESSNKKWRHIRFGSGLLLSPARKPKFTATGSFTRWVKWWYFAIGCMFYLFFSFIR